MIIPSKCSPKCTLPLRIWEQLLQLPRLGIISLGFYFYFFLMSRFHKTLLKKAAGRSCKHQPHPEYRSLCFLPRSSTQDVDPEKSVRAGLNLQMKFGLSHERARGVLWSFFAEHPTPGAGLLLFPLTSACEARQIPGCCWGTRVRGIGGSKEMFTLGGDC